MKRAFYISLLVGLAGCTPLSKTAFKTFPVTPVTKKDFAKLNGVYKTTPERFAACAPDYLHGLRPLGL